MQDAWNSRSQMQLRNSATEHVTAIENNPDRIKALFKDPTVANAV